MSRPDEVMARALSWVHIPAGAPEVRTSQFQLVAFPEDWPTPTAVFQLDSQRPASDVVDDVLAAARDLGRTGVTFWTHDGIRPVGLVDELIARGGVRAEVLAVLARPLSPVVDLDEPDVEIRTADVVETLRDFDAITAEVFGGPRSDDAALTEDAAAASLETGLGWVAYREGIAVAAAAATVRDDAVRLWGAATRPGSRGTGAYRALLGHRLRVASDAGCRLALVEGRVASSTPILLRAGFVQHGERTSYRLAAPS